jgi:hypothetical protein
MTGRLRESGLAAQIDDDGGLERRRNPASRRSEHQLPAAASSLGRPLGLNVVVVGGKLAAPPRIGPDLVGVDIDDEDTAAGRARDGAEAPVVRFEPRQRLVERRMLILQLGPRRAVWPLVIRAAAVRLAARHDLQAWGVVAPHPVSQIGGLVVVVELVFWSKKATGARPLSRAGSFGRSG